MKRLLEFISASRADRDGHGFMLLSGICIIAVWLLALPFSPTIQRVTIERFHLRSGSFLGWVLQQPIPPMYNLENRIWFSKQPLKHSDLVDHPRDGVETLMLNHFPARAATCADGRWSRLRYDQEGWLYLRSRYQESEQVTAYRIENVLFINKEGGESSAMWMAAVELER